MTDDITRARTEPYLVLTTSDGTASSVIHQPTGRTVARFDQADHRDRASSDAASRNARGVTE